MKSDQKLQRPINKNNTVIFFSNTMHDIFPIFQYTKDLKELDGKIIECAWDGKQWIYLRQRTDKSFPNSIKTAEGRHFMYFSLDV